MKYFIAYLLSGNAEKRHNFLSCEIEKYFKLIRGTPPHVTLKSPFETDKIEAVEKILEPFAKKHNKVSLNLTGFGSFDKDVIYVHVMPSSGQVGLVKDLDRELKKLPWLVFRKFEKNRILHSSLIHEGLTEKFDEVWEFLAGETFDYTVELDNISILKQDDGIWTVHRKYNL